MSTNVGNFGDTADKQMMRAITNAPLPNYTETRLIKDNSGQLFDYLIKKFNLKNDAALARFLEVLPPVISKIRKGKLPVGPTIVLRLAEHHDMPIRMIRELILAK